MQFEVTYLIDVVSKNLADYTIKEIVDAADEIDAVKKLAISRTRKDSSNIEWIQSLTGTLQEVKNELMRNNYCITHVERVE